MYVYTNNTVIILVHVLGNVHARAGRQGCMPYRSSSRFAKPKSVILM